LDFGCVTLAGANVTSRSCREVESRAILISGFPEAELSNGQIRLRVYLPDAKAGFYRATRFDWSGMIGSLLYKGHEFYGPWFQRVAERSRFQLRGRGYRGQSVHCRRWAGRRVRYRCEPAAWISGSEAGGDVCENRCGRAEETGRLGIRRIRISPRFAATRLCI
jgi:hypothetical protein